MATSTKHMYRWLEGRLVEEPKMEWWRVKGGRAVHRPPAVFGNAYFLWTGDATNWV